MLDAVALAARIAPVVPGIGLVPTATVTHTEPFHVSKAIATLDIVSARPRRLGARRLPHPGRGRTCSAARPAAPPDVLWREAADAIEVVVRLWDSWEDDAVIRDAATGRYVDRDKLHYIDFEGEFFSVKGPSITPRPPQGHPLVVLRADEAEALPVAARWADVVRIAAPDLPRRRGRPGADPRRPSPMPGRDPDEVDRAARRRGALRRRRATGPAATSPSWTDHGSCRRPRCGCVGPPTDLADLVGVAVRTRAADGVTLVPLVLPADLDVVAEQARAAARRARAAAHRAAAGGSLRARFGLSPAGQPLRWRRAR